MVVDVGPRWSPLESGEDADELELRRDFIKWLKVSYNVAFDITNYAVSCTGQQRDALLPQYSQHRACGHEVTWPWESVSSM